MILLKPLMLLKFFWWNDLCDVYLELIKPLMWEKQSLLSTQQEACAVTLYNIVDNFLRLVHPFMPFISEELWQRMQRRPNDPPALIVSQFPSIIQERENFEVDNDMKTINDYLRCIRGVLSTYNINKKFKPGLTISTTSESRFQLCQTYREHLQTLGYIGEIEIGMNLDAPPKCAINVPDEDTTFYIHIASFVETKTEIAKLTKKLDLLSTSISKLETKRASPAYQRVPDNVREKDIETQQNSIKERDTVLAALEFLQTLEE